HKIRHLTVDDVENPSIYEAKKLRTLVAKSSKSVPSALHQLTCLRTLDLSRAYGASLEVLPSEVNRLLHLRYLDLSHTRLKELPETVRSLVNLQTLKLNWCRSLCRLPEGIGELSNLRHLEAKVTSSLKYYPRGGIERLSQLRTLNKFVVSDGSSKGSVIGELGNLNFLKGRLSITGLRHVKSVNEAKHAELQKKKNITGLQFNLEYERHISSLRGDTKDGRCCDYALLILEYWADAPEIQQAADLYEDLIKCCVADTMSEDLHDVRPLQPCYFCPALSKSCKDNEEAREDGFVERGRPASSAEVKRIGKLQDGTVFLKKGRDDDELFEFKTDERNSLDLAEQVIDGLDRAVVTMKKGEVAELTIAPEYGCFSENSLSTALALCLPGKKKEEGNVAFIAGKYAEASQRYEKAGKFIEYNTNFSEEENKKSKVLKVSCNLNNAACKLKLKDYEKAEKLCTKVIKLESTNVKALYRRAQAYIQLADLDLAEIDIKKALEIDPNYRKQQLRQQALTVRCDG
ncbi:hypothetical protein IFM89_034893, partial [Coptis chinensis]